MTLAELKVKVATAIRNKDARLNKVGAHGLNIRQINLDKADVTTINRLKFRMERAEAFDNDYYSPEVIDYLMGERS